MRRLIGKWKIVSVYLFQWLLMMFRPDLAALERERWTTPVCAWVPWKSIEARSKGGIMSKPERDDVVLWVVIGLCILIPVVLTSLWALRDLYYPPMLIAVLLGIAIAALTYRYLGGAAESQFSMGVLKVAGSAALLLGTAYLTNSGLSAQMDRDNAPNRLATAIKERNQAKGMVEALQTSLEAANRGLEVAQTRQAEIVVSDIEKLSPSSVLGTQLADMARKRIGPFSQVAKVLEVQVTVVGSIGQPERFYACENLRLAAEEVRFTRIVDEQLETGIRTASGRQGGIIESAVCNRTPRRFDIQIGCEDGASLFPEHIAGCNGDGSVGWKIPNGERVFLVSAEVLRT